MGVADASPCAIQTTEACQHAELEFSCTIIKELRGLPNVAALSAIAQRQAPAATEHRAWTMHGIPKRQSHSTGLNPETPSAHLLAIHCSRGSGGRGARSGIDRRLYHLLHHFHLHRRLGSVQNQQAVGVDLETQRHLAAGVVLGDDVRDAGHLKILEID